MTATITRAGPDQTKEAEAVGCSHCGGPHRVVSDRVAALALRVVKLLRVHHAVIQGMDTLREFEDVQPLAI